MCNMYKLAVKQANTSVYGIHFKSWLQLLNKQKVLKSMIQQGNTHLRNVKWKSGLEYHVGRKKTHDQESSGFCIYL